MEPLKKYTHLFVLLLSISLVFYYLSDFLVPFAFGVFLATLIVPFAEFLERQKFHRVWSSLTSTLLLFICFGFLAFLFMFQITQFAGQLPDVREEIQATLESVQLHIASATGVPPDEQKEFVDGRTDALWSTIESWIAVLVGGIVDFTFKFLLVFIYAFLLLLYRKKFRDFMISLFNKEEEKENANDAMNRISNVVYQYLWGRLQVMSALAVMYYITFLIFGLPFALLLTLFGALITIIPYIGPLFSGVVPVLFAFIFFDEFTVKLTFTLIILVIHLVETYVLEPYIIGKELKINALAVIVAVLLGGFFWGVAGMILFVPIFATMKIIFNHTKRLKPLANLLNT